MREREGGGREDVILVTWYILHYNNQKLTPRQHNLGNLTPLRPAKPKIETTKNILWRLFSLNDDEDDGVKPPPTWRQKIKFLTDQRRLGVEFSTEDGEIKIFTYYSWTFATNLFVHGSHTDASALAHARTHTKWLISDCASPSHSWP